MQLLVTHFVQDCFVPTNVEDASSINQPCWSSQGQLVCFASPSTGRKAWAAQQSSHCSTIDGLAISRLQRWSVCDILCPAIADSPSCYSSSVSMCLPECLQLGKAIDVICSSEASELHSRLLLKADATQTTAASFALPASLHVYYHSIIPD